MIDKTSDLSCKTNPLTYDKFIDDVKYIKQDCIAQLPNGKYMKYSKLLKAVSIIEFTEKDYIRYWNTRYIRNGKETKFYKDIIKEVENKFENNLISLDEMKSLIQTSHDNTIDKAKALKLLKEK